MLSRFCDVCFWGWLRKGRRRVRIKPVTSDFLPFFCLYVLNRQQPPDRPQGTIQHVFGAVMKEQAVSGLNNPIQAGGDLREYSSILFDRLAEIAC
jgi:hypothetical protein